MPKPRIQTIFVCSKCDAQSPKWNGQCLECGAWGTLAAARPDYAPQSPARPAAKAAARPVTRLDGVRAGENGRLTTGIGEADRVFGGGIMTGSVTLLGGEPGIGKSTLALMIAANVAKAAGPVVYVSGEESAAQVKQRADRLKLDVGRVLFLGETEAETVIATLEKEKPALAIIDSVQTIFAADIPSEAGALNQVRGAAARLTAFAKKSGLPLLLIGHVTKDGNVAGPKTLEHVVDAVLSFEGERSHRLRVLRSMKNRFGSTEEAGIFDMTETGLAEVKNPSAFLLDERQPGAPGSVVCCVLEGTRPMLVEIQALVRRTAFGYPVRRASGFDQARLEMLVAVLGGRGGVDLGQDDVYVNVVGGLKVKEPAADLAVVAALISAAKNRPLPAGAAVWGEVGLGGEIRSVPAVDRRLNETAKLGLKEVITPLPKGGKVKVPAGLKVTEVRAIREMI